MSALTVEGVQIVKAKARTEGRGCRVEIGVGKNSSVRLPRLRISQPESWNMGSNPSAA